MRNTRTRIGAVVATFVLATSLAACGGDSEADATASELAGDSIDEICAAGPDEGTLRREATPDQAADWQAYGGAFTDEYDIEVVVTDGAGGGGRDLPAKFLPEKQADRAFSSDIFQARQYEVSVLLNDDYTVDVDWAALGYSEDMLSTDADHRGLRTERHPFGLTYNSEKYPADELPATYEELIDPQWEGKIAIDPTGSQLGPLAMADGMGADGAREWFDEFYDVVKPVVFEGNTASAQAIATGQFDLTLNSSQHNVKSQTDAGLPVDFKFLDYVPLNDLYHFVVAGTPRQNAAVCFANWWSSPDGGTAVMNELEGVSNDDIPPGTPDDSAPIAAQSEEDIQAAADFADYVAQKLGG
jgi:ABC-type Fe3+ transport system substrate-binding protein